MLLVALASTAHSSGDNSGKALTKYAGYELGVSSLKSVQSGLGLSPIVKSGDAGDFVASVCYYTQDKKVRFLSGELGGKELLLLGFELETVVASNDETKISSCVRWPRQKKYLPSKKVGALQLGINKAEFSRLTNREIQWDGNTAHTAFESRRKMTKLELARHSNKNRQDRNSVTVPDYFDVLISVIGTFEGGKLVRLQVWKTETI